MQKGFHFPLKTQKKRPEESRFFTNNSIFEVRLFNECRASFLSVFYLNQT
jgi:hypothetical protein